MRLAWASLCGALAPGLPACLQRTLIGLVATPPCPWWWSVVSGGVLSLPLEASGRATDELRRGGVGAAAATLWLDDGGALGVAEDSGVAGGTGPPPPVEF